MDGNIILRVSGDHLPNKSTVWIGRCGIGVDKMKIMHNDEKSINYNMIKL